MKNIFHVLCFFVTSVLHFSLQKEFQQGFFVHGPICFKQREDVKCEKQTSNETETCVNESAPEIYFYLFTQKNKHNPEFLHDCGGKLPANTNYDPNAKTEIFIHGYLNSPCLIPVFREFKDQLFCRGNYNVILVDYSKYVIPDYGTSVQNTRPCAKRIACVVRNILAQKSVSKDKFHLIGHSLGAHVAGFVGKIVRGLGRITGLDPAGPGFLKKTPNDRLDKCDAKLVDVLHTDGGDCLPFFGTPEAIGHMDFYINGGSIQLNSVQNIVLSLLKFDVLTAIASLIITGGSHNQALQYYKTTINPCKCEFVGVECKSHEEFKSGSCKRKCNSNGSNCAVAGMNLVDYYYPKDNCSHKYYFDTGFICPYCDNSGIELNNFFRNTNPKGYQEHCCKISSDGAGFKEISPL